VTLRPTFCPQQSFLHELYKYKSRFYFITLVVVVVVVSDLSSATSNTRKGLFQLLSYELPPACGLQLALVRKA
jgi:hypothetical protein